MNLLGHKLIALFSILGAIFVCTALPIKVSEWFRRRGRLGQAIVSALMCFGSGFFLGTLLLHNLPEVVQMSDRIIAVPCNAQFPVGYFVVGCGFFLMLLTEKAVTELVEMSDRRKASTGREELMDCAGDNDATEGCEGGSAGKSVELLPLKGETVTKRVGYATRQGEGTVKQLDKVISAVDVSPGDQQGSSGGEPGHSHGSGSAVKSIVLLLALSIDCVFEGLSLGLQMTIQGVWQMVAAILSHELIVAFGLGLQLTKHNLWWKSLAMSFVYACTCPAGIAAGLAINESGADTLGFHVTQAILIGITGGVFLYVTFFEMLMPEFEKEVKFVNIMAVLLGYSIMAVVVAFGHEASDSDADARTDNYIIANMTPVVPCMF